MVGVNLWLFLYLYIVSIASSLICNLKQLNFKLDELAKVLKQTGLKMIK